MHTLDGKLLLFALCLAALAGCVDAIGFLTLGGHFISFMSGNSTQIAVGMAQGNGQGIVLLAAIIACFVTGTILGTALGHSIPPARRPRSVLLLVTALLATAASLYSLGQPLAAALIMTLAMGAENATLRGEGNATIGVTYMTGALVKLGQGLAHRLLGEKSPWFPYLLLWLGLIAGGVTGATLFHFFGLYSLWLATLWAALLAAISA